MKDTVSEYSPPPFARHRPLVFANLGNLFAILGLYANIVLLMILYSGQTEDNKELRSDMTQQHNAYQELLANRDSMITFQRSVIDNRDSTIDQYKRISRECIVSLGGCANSLTYANQQFDELKNVLGRVPDAGRSQMLGTEHFR